MPNMQANYMPQPQQMNTQPQNQMLRGRTVTSVDEVRASSVVMDGMETYFPLPAENAIYTKYVDLNGNAVIKKYVQTQENPNKEEAALRALEERVKTLEAFVNELNSPVKKDGVSQ